ncbi:MAG TPA: hypothetical protein VHV55_23575 [Pirellulales bacterium]|jgi:hypothetical protein|nr:hypothetical protein [Pirellulales bacterium]
MRRMQIIVATLPVILLAPGWLSADTSLPEAVKTSQREFSIPYDLDDWDPTGEKPVAVQLHLSEDHGVNWRVYSKAPAESGAFDFRAPQLGEYWFAVRTVDRNGKLWPDSTPRPEMRVVVEPLRAAQAVKAGYPVNRMPQGSRARMVNSLSFELDYDVQALDEASPSKVELWWTGDGGVSWNLFGLDDDNRSPMLVTVEHEGLYGFWMVIEGTGGLRGNAPKAGDLPQVWVGVDMTKPAAKLVTAKLVSGDAGDQIQVRWEAGDALLAKTPVSLDYAVNPTGPWTPLAVDIENRGSYACRINQRLPHTLYVRLHVRDEAGNEQLAQLSAPVNVVVTSGSKTTTSSAAPAASNTAKGSRWLGLFR